MSNQLNVSIIGSGNLAWHLAPELDNIGYVVREIYSRNIKNAKSLIDLLYQAEPKTDLDFSESISDVFIISVSDDVIEGISKEIIVPQDAIIVHTSGSQPMEILNHVNSRNIGVFYPLQTFSKRRKVIFSDVPICIEAQNSYTWEALKKMSNELSKRVYKINSQSREALHVAAVFACNFTNHLFTIADDILSKNKLDLEIIKPLIVETINKMLEMGPQNSQTGPAIRGDLTTLEKHLTLLERNKTYASIYKNISQDILDTYFDGE